MRNIRGRVQIKIFAGTVYRHYIKGTGSNISATQYAEYKRLGIKYFPRMKMRGIFVRRKNEIWILLFSYSVILTRLTNSGIVYLKEREIRFQKSFPETVEKQHKH